MPAAEDDLLGQGKKLLASLRAPAPWQVELYLQSERFREVGWSEKHPEDTRSGWTRGMALRAIKQGRQGFAFSHDLSVESAQKLWRDAAAAASLLTADAARTLPLRRTARGRGETLDASLFKSSVKSLQSRLAAAEKSLLRLDRRLKKALRLSVSESLGAEAVVNSQGLAVQKTASAVSFSAEVMGEHRGEVQVAWSYRQRRSWKDLVLGPVAEETGRRVLESFEARPLPSGAWTVIFDPWVGADILELISDALCADQVQRGKSLFANRRGEAVASSRVTLIDDGRLPKGLASALYDDEGQPMETTVLVEKGVLKDFLYDTVTANREGRSGNGKAGRPGLSGPPSPDSTNFYMAPGAVPRDKLLAETPRAFLVREVLGMHTADFVSGDFSVGATGLLVKNGKVDHPVKGVTLAGNVLDLLKKVDGVASDLTWHGSTGAPTFRVSGLSVGGS